MSRGDVAVGAAVEAPSYCGHCGEMLDGRSHDACVERLRFEPPRFCGHCRRRMVVQVTPTSWTARCVEHGELASP